jgi:hypothetical protein
MGEAGVAHNPLHVLEEVKNALDLIQQPEDL